MNWRDTVLYTVEETYSIDYLFLTGGSVVDSSPPLTVLGELQPSVSHVFLQLLASKSKMVSVTHSVALPLVNGEHPR